MPQIPIEELKKDLIVRDRLKGHELTFHTTWGLFSPEKIDTGTRALLEAAVVGPRDTILDLGCGYGAIGIALAKLAPEGKTVMVDKDFVAVEYARKNAVLNGVAKNTETYLSNGFNQIPTGQRFKVIISNLPAKISKEFFWILFKETYDRLEPGGTFYVVTIAGLQRFIEKNFQIIFGNYNLIASQGTYFIAAATKPAATTGN
jgi:16S rRNA G1207 methylase RsmC